MLMGQGGLGGICMGCEKWLCAGVRLCEFAENDIILSKEVGNMKGFL